MQRFIDQAIADYQGTPTRIAHTIDKWGEEHVLIESTTARDPRAAAIAYGQRTGTCSCCGRELTRHSSIDAGIGPVCATKWGLG